MAVLTPSISLAWDLFLRVKYLFVVAIDGCLILAVWMPARRHALATVNTRFCVLRVSHKLLVLRAGKAEAAACAQTVSNHGQPIGLGQFRP